MMTLSTKETKQQKVCVVVVVVGVGWGGVKERLETVFKKV